MQPNNCVCECATGYMIHTELNANVFVSLFAFCWSLQITTFSVNFVNARQKTNNRFCDLLTQWSEKRKEVYICVEIGGDRIVKSKRKTQNNWIAWQIYCVWCAWSMWICKIIMTTTPMIIRNWLIDDRLTMIKLCWFPYMDKYTNHTTAMMATMLNLKITFQRTSCLVYCWWWLYVVKRFLLIEQFANFNNQMKINTATNRTESS